MSVRIKFSTRYPDDFLKNIILLPFVSEGLFVDYDKCIVLCPGPTSHTLKQSETYLTKSNASLQFYIQLQVIFSHIFSQRKVFSQKVWQQECQTFLKNIFQELFIQLTSPELLKTILQMVLLAVLSLCLTSKLS